MVRVTISYGVVSYIKLFVYFYFQSALVFYVAGSDIDIYLLLWKYFEKFRTWAQKFVIIIIIRKERNGSAQYIPTIETNMLV